MSRHSILWRLKCTGPDCMAFPLRYCIAPYTWLGRRVLTFCADPSGRPAPRSVTRRAGCARGAACEGAGSLFAKPGTNPPADSRLLPISVSRIPVSYLQLASEASAISYPVAYLRRLPRHAPGRMGTCYETYTRLQDSPRGAE